MTTATTTCAGLVALASSLTLVGSPCASDERKQATRAIEFTARGSFDEVFPLFGPLREAEWAHDWKPTFVFPAQGTNDQAGAVFTTEGHSPDRQRVWIMTDYDRSAGAIRYVTVEAGHSTAEIRIRVTPVNAVTCAVTVTYRRTALSPEGDGSIDVFAAQFEKEAPHWKEMVNRRLRGKTP